MMLTPDLLQRATGCTPAAAARYAAQLDAACRAYSIYTPARMAMFLAQIGHESGGLQWVAELWGPTEAQARYEGRADLGNTQPGDGYRYRGRGLIQTTGRHNYRAITRRLRARGVQCPDFESEPDALTQPAWAVLSAADYWDGRDLNAWADAGDIAAVTRRINGGLNGLADRTARWERAKAALAADAACRQDAAATEHARPADEPPPLPPAGDPQAHAPDHVGGAAEKARHTPAIGPAEAQSMPQEAPPVIPAFIAAALPALIDAAPALVRVFGSERPSVEKAAKAAEAVAAVAMRATGADTVEGAVRAIQSSPEQAAAYREAVHQDLAELTAAMDRAARIDEASRASAVDRAVQLGRETGGRWLYLLGAVAVAVVLGSYAIVLLVLTREGFSDETRAMLLGQVVILGFGTVVSFLFGSNFSNRVEQARRNQGDGGNE